MHKINFQQRLELRNNELESLCCQLKSEMEEKETITTMVGGIYVQCHVHVDAVLSQGYDM